MFITTECIAALVLAYLFVEVSSSTGGTEMKVHNHAGHPIELFWINTFSPDRELVLQTEKPIRNSSHASISSYDTHEFLVKFHSTQLLHSTIEGHFIKGPKDEDVEVSFDTTLNVFSIKQSTEYDRWAEKIKTVTDNCTLHNSHDVSSCVAQHVYKGVADISQHKAALVKYRNLISNRLRNYTCADPTMNTSTPIESFRHYHSGRAYNVGLLLNMSHAKIWTIKDFITESECKKFKEHADGKLKRATIAADDGSSIVSIHRKASQAHYSMPIDNPEHDFLWPLYNRATTFANKFGKLNIQHPGQEDFTIIQYNPTDEYTPRMYTCSFMLVLVSQLQLCIL
jgi:hypothetical protein